MRDPLFLTRDDLVRKFAKAGTGYPMNVVADVNAIMIINALRQSHTTLAGAEAELNNMVERMKAALRERHYQPNGYRRVNNIVMPPLGAMFPELAKQEG